METSPNILMNEEQFEIYPIELGKMNFGINESFDFKNHQIDPIYLSNSLMMTVHSVPGRTGLSAPQVNIPLDVIYVYGFASAMFNPKIVDRSEGTSYLEEVSCTFPKLVLKIKRPDVIRVRWTNCIGETQTDVFSGLTARIIQRKVDFLEGMLPQGRATKFHRNQAFKHMMRDSNEIKT